MVGNSLAVTPFFPKHCHKTIIMTSLLILISKQLIQMGVCMIFFCDGEWGGSLVPLGLSEWQVLNGHRVFIEA